MHDNWMPSWAYEKGFSLDEWKEYNKGNLLKKIKMLLKKR